MARGPPDDLAESGMNECAKCGRQRLLVALHGNRGGPEVCIECSGELLTVAKERRRHADRMRRGHENALKDVLSRRAVEDGAIAERMDASYLAELLDDKVLEDLIHLAHPDRHPPARKAAATRATAALTAMRPFVRPHRPPPPRDVSAGPIPARDRPAVTAPYPCDVCRYLYRPALYCGPCRERWQEIRRRDADRVNARRRDRRAHDKQLRELNVGWAGTECEYCGGMFTPKRKDARYCSPAHRQAAYRARRDGSIDRQSVSLVLAVTEGSDG